MIPPQRNDALRRRDVQGSGGNVRPQFIEAFHQGGHQPQGHVLATAQVGLGDLIALCVIVYVYYIHVHNNIYIYDIYIYIIARNIIYI